jgi:hypothetical protein
LQLGDERVVTAFGLFKPTLLDQTTAVGTAGFAVKQTPLTKYSDPEDPFDAQYLKVSSSC